MFGLAVLVYSIPSLAVAADPYAALRERDYATAISSFQEAISANPNKAALRKDLAYTLLKVGENAAARRQFAAALELTPNDEHLALEYAFLCYEAHPPEIRLRQTARRLFHQVRKSADQNLRDTAERAFQNVDAPLAAGIARWSEVLAHSPNNYAAHADIARLAEERDMPALALDHYEQAWRLRPDQQSLLVDQGRVLSALGRTEEAITRLLAAAHGAGSRAAESARELLPKRYPYVYEFRRAVAFEPANAGLRRELAYLLLAMDQRKEAEQEFDLLTTLAPGDLWSFAQLGFLRLARGDLDGGIPLLERVLRSNDELLADRVRATLRMPQNLRPQSDASRPDAKTMAEKSLQAGYLKDALRYFTIAHDNDPLDFGVMLKLGQTHNMLKQDRDALRWFDLARHSPEASLRATADRAFRNLRPQFSAVRFTSWMFPFYSSRWSTTFGYGQSKAEFRLGNLPFRPYLSARFVGDTRRTIGDVQPQFLSESSLIIAAGLATRNWRGLMAWGEAGQAVRYVNRNDVGRMIPDYRGGLSFGKAWGRSLGSGSPGFYYETNADAVFVSRFQNDTLLYSMNRAGYTLGPVQFYWNANLTMDRLRQYWANYAEAGPGLRFRLPHTPQSLFFVVDVLRGVYLINDANPRRPNFFDIRAGFWYAFTY